MGDDRTGTDEGFLSRWSRRKIEARESPPEPIEAAAPEPAPEEAAPALPPVEELTMDSDFRGFFHPKVDEDLRRSALRKLFSDPHFNVMDGLDTYIDDYSKSEPIPPEMLAGLKQAQRILTWAEGKDEEPEESTEPAAAKADEAEPGAAAVESAPASTNTETPQPSETVGSTNQ
jgi:hypothetical protein